MTTLKSWNSCWTMALVFMALAARPVTAQTKIGSLLWEREIAAFEKQDRTNPPPNGAILFLGSSSIRKWTNLPAAFPGKQVINRGFGGSQIADSVAFADRIVFPYEPRMIVFYAGDNDLAAGKSPDQVAGDFKAFVAKVHAQLPKTRIAFISVKPCPLRWKLVDKVKAVNEQVKAIKDEELTFIDIYPLMLGADGLPRKELFEADGLHPNAKCYELWADKIRPYLD